MQPAPSILRRTTVRVALVVLAVVVALSVAEVTSERFSAFIQDHSLISAFITEAILLVGAYLVIDEVIQRRETRRWADVTSLGIRALSTRADGPTGVIRRALDELDGVDAVRSGSVDYQAVLSERAGELADWLRADEVRSRSFAEDMRRNASRLEEAITRWGPTLVEDPDSAELLNLLPDIVDSARSAADAIVPGPQRRTDGDRQVFEASVHEILKDAEEFGRRVPVRRP